MSSASRSCIGFEKVYAPFDGVITARNIDTGQLDRLGALRPRNSSTCRPFRPCASIPTCRVFRRASEARPEDRPDLCRASGKTFQGTLVRTADAIDPASRTLLVEIDVDNRARASCCPARWPRSTSRPRRRSNLHVPASALIFRSEGLRVARWSTATSRTWFRSRSARTMELTVQIVTGLKRRRSE
jgi:hypothetical protein